MNILHFAHVKQLQRQHERPWVLRACRNNGFFHWRPSLSLGRLVKASGQDWAEQLVEGSYRLVPRWIAERGSFVDAEGVPMRPQFDMYAKARAIAAEAELEYCRQEGYMHVAKSLENVKLIEHHSSIDSDQISEDLKAHTANLADLCSAKVQRKLKHLSIFNTFYWSCTCRSRTSSNNYTCRHRRHSEGTKE